MKYIIMADGKESRWNNFQGIHKWQIKVGHQTLLERTCGLLHSFDSSATIIITSHDPSLQIEGATRHEPAHNVLEVDRFTAELIAPDVCFLYGDCYYSEDALRQVIRTETDSVLFFGNKKKIFAVKVHDAALFAQHVQRVRQLFLNGQIRECIGWEVYHSLQGMQLENRQIGMNYICIEDGTRDFNAPEDLLSSPSDQPE